MEFYFSLAIIAWFLSFSLCSSQNGKRIHVLTGHAWVIRKAIEIFLKIIVFLRIFLGSLSTSVFLNVYTTTSLKTRGNYPTNHDNCSTFGLSPPNSETCRNLETASSYKQFDITQLSLNLLTDISLVPHCTVT